MTSGRHGNSRRGHRPGLASRKLPIGVLARLARNPLTRVPVRLHRKPLLGLPLGLAKWGALLDACHRRQNEKAYHSDVSVASLLCTGIRTLLAKENCWQVQLLYHKAKQRKVDVEKRALH